MLSTFTIRRLLRSSLFRIYLPTALCFLVINVTNTRILEVMARHGVMYATSPDAAANLEKTRRFFLTPIKSFLFFVCTAVLILPLGAALIEKMQRHLKREHILRTLTSFLLCIALVATVLPTAFGRFYGRESTDPFNQDVSQLYRRLLLPGLANLYHVDGFLYTFFFWGIVFLTALVVRLYFLRKGVNLSVLQELSLLTVGIFASSFQVPGYPEIAVLLLGVFALIELDADRSFTTKQLAAFALALMAHEACAIIVFAPMILFLFGRKSWVPTGAVTLLYGFFLLLNFSFNPYIPFHVQSTISETPATDYFLNSPSTVLIAAAFSFKLLWIFLPIGLYFLVGSNYRVACYVIVTVAMALASTYIAVDYTRLIGFATIPMMICFLKAQEKLPARAFRAIVTLNILVPSFYVGGNCGLVVLKGLYYIAYRSVFRLPAPAF